MKFRRLESCFTNLFLSCLLACVSGFPQLDASSGREMQHQSPAISSPSTGFLGPRASPLFNSSLDQNIDGGGIYSSDLLRPSMVGTRATQDEDQQAPPKRLSRAMESLGQAHRLIADVRSGADLILEALETAVIRRWRENVGEIQAPNLLFYWWLQVGVRV